jgi:hypothetical protein
VVGERQEGIDNLRFLWDYAPGGNVEHIAEHGVTPEQVEE